MKPYTNKEQSKRLSEILPLESADQTWEIIAIAGDNLDVLEGMKYWHNGNTPYFLNSKLGVPCWSLAALLEVLLHPSLCDTSGEWRCQCYKEDHIVATAYADNPVDACVKMVLKLKEKDLL